MRFAFRMAVRELRASWKRLLFFFVSIAVGVAAMVTLRSVIQSVRIGLTRESRAITAADVLLRTNRPWTDELRAELSRRLADAPVLGETESIQTTTMVRTDAPVTTMVELRAVEPDFPYYGEMVLESGVAYSHRILAGGGAIVRRELLTRLGIDVGDRIWIGRKAFTVRDVIVKEAGRPMGMFNLGPRVLINYADIHQTGIVQFGSRASFDILLKVADEGIDRLTEDLREDFKGRFLQVRSFREAGDRINRRLARSENYLSLTGLVIVILGGIGVWSVVRVFIQQKLKSIAVLKCLGATTREVLATYLLQVIGLGFTGSLMGVAMAKGVLAAFPPERLGLEVQGVSYGLTASAVAQGMGVGVLVSLLFSLVPLLEIRRVKPLLLLRPGSGELQPGRAAGWRVRGVLWTALARTDRSQAIATALVTAALVGLATWQAGSLRVGLWVTVGFAVSAFVLHLTGVALVKMVAPLSRRAWFPLRHAVIHVSRPGNQTRVILLAVGLGAFLILSMYTIEVHLLDQFQVELEEDGPDMFLIDIQADQETPLIERARSIGADYLRLVPVLRARVVGVQGRQLRLDGYEQVGERGWLGREFVVTFRDHLESNERIVQGRFWNDSPAAEPEVSIEASFVEDYDMEVGDTIRFDILGRTVSARVSSVREVEWSDSRNGGFMFVFRPGSLEGAPHSFLGFLKGPSEPSQRGKFQRELIAGFENISIIDLRDILDTLRGIVGRVSVAVSVVGGIALFSGGLILMGSVAMTRFQRSYETAIFRTLGASRRDLTVMMLLEYGTVGALAGAVGGLGALVMSWALSRQVLEIEWRPLLSPSLLGIVLTSLGVSVVGVALALDVLKHKPLSILRAE